MKNPNSYGSIVNLGKNRRKPFGIRITTGWNEDGKQIRKYVSYHETRREAMMALAKFNENPYDVDSSKLTVKDVFKLWYEKEENKMSKQNLASYRSAFKHVEDIENMKFIDVKTIHIQKMVDKINKGYATKVKIKHLFSKMYKYAFENDIQDKNYAQYLEIENDGEVRIERIPYSIDEIKEVMAIEDKLLYDTVKILLFTGMRITELLEMKTENIFLDERIMIGGIKTNAGKNRRIPIAKTILPIIQKYYNTDNEYLITSRRASKFTYSNYSKQWRRTIKNHLPHDTRHTFVTFIDNIEGIDKVAVKKIIGHIVGNVTDDIYNHKDSEQLLKVIDKYDEYMQKALM